MRIIAGVWRGRHLASPPGQNTRPTADRVRQALFDMLWHAPWGGRALLEGAQVLDAFAGTGAYGLEALSRGAARAFFIERDRGALAALRRNIALCRAEDRAQIIAVDALAPPAGSPCGLVFLDPPYRQGLLQPALTALKEAKYIVSGTIVATETAHNEALELPSALALELVANRTHGAARIAFWRAA